MLLNFKYSIFISIHGPLATVLFEGLTMRFRLLGQETLRVPRVLIGLLRDGLPHSVVRVEHTPEVVHLHPLQDDITRLLVETDSVVFLDRAVQALSGWRVEPRHLGSPA